MKSLLPLLFIFIFCPALAQPGQARSHGDPGRYLQREYGRPMPPPEPRMTWEDRQRLREQVRGGNMTRDEARERWRDRRFQEPMRSPEDRQRLRRDILDANRDLERR